MNKNELIAHVAETAGLTKTQASAAVDAIFHPASGAITTTLKQGGRFTLAGFGSFVPKDRPERTGRNPRTGAELKIAASRGAGFSAGKSFKDALNG